MKKFLILFCAVALVVATSGMANANTIATSTIVFQGNLADEGGGVYSGVLAAVGDSGFDIYAKAGASAWFGDSVGGVVTWTEQVIGTDHDAWPSWTLDTPDWYAYSLEFYADGSDQKWAVRNHPGSNSASNPWYDGSDGSTEIARGVPLSGSMNWTNMYALETDTGAYLSGTGIAEIPGGAAGHGGGAAAWDMDWSWGSEVVPLEYPGFRVNIEDLGSGSYQVSLTPDPVPEPATMFLLGSGLVGLAGFRRKKKK